MRQRDYLISVAVLAISTIACVAHAQPANELEELVITAEKREQKLQDVPVSVSAFTAAKRDLIGIDSVQDIANFTPGLSYSTVNDRLSLRGVSRFSNNLATESGIANYSDGIWTSATVEASKTPLFVERVEVLRGPQGTLYGRNAIGGAINTISRRPTKDWYGEARARVGNYQFRAVEAAVSGPINDHLRMRLGATKVDQDKGYFKNLSGNPSEGGRLDQWYAEGQLEGDLADNKLEWWVKFAGASFDNPGGGVGGRSSSLIGSYDSTLVINSVIPNVVIGLNQPFPASATGDLRTIDTNTTQRMRIDQNAIVSGETVLHLNGADLKYIGGYQHYLYRQLTDGDASSRSTPFAFPGGTGASAAAAGTIIFPTMVNNYTEDHWWFSNELNLTSTGGGPLQWLVGAYQFHENLVTEISAGMPDQPQIGAPLLCDSRGVCTAGVPNPSRNFLLNRNDGSAMSFAGYGQVDYSFAGQFTLHLGARYTWDQKKAFESVRLICFLSSQCPSTAPARALDVTNAGVSGLPPAGFAPDRAVVGPIYVDPTTGQKHRMLKADWQAWSGTAGLDWTPDDTTLGYVKYTRGYKAGGFNAASLTAFPTTRSEFIDAYEVGLKKTLLGGKLQANAAAFYYDYQDIQVPLTGPINGVNITQLFNVPKARNTGFEIETVWAPIENLQILANYAYLNAKITEGCCFVDPQDPTAVAVGANRVTPAGAQDLDGQKLPFSPPHRVTVNTNYTWLFGPGRLNGSATWIWRDDTYYSIFNRGYNRAKAYDQVDLRATWTDAADRYSVIGYAKNVFDRTGYDGASATLQSGSRRLYQTLGLTPPRTYGLELQYRFF